MFTKYVSAALQLFCLVALFGCNSGSVDNSADADNKVDAVPIWSAEEGAYSPRLFSAFDGTDIEGEQYRTRQIIYVVNIEDESGNSKQVATAERFVPIVDGGLAAKATKLVYIDFDSRRLEFVDVGTGISLPTPLASFPEGAHACELEVIKTGSPDDYVVRFRILDGEVCGTSNKLVKLSDWNEPIPHLPDISGTIIPIYSETLLNGYLHIEFGALNLLDSNFSYLSSLVKEGVINATVIDLKQDTALIKVRYESDSELRALNIVSYGFSENLNRNELEIDYGYESVYSEESQAWFVSINQDIFKVSLPGLEAEIVYQARGWVDDLIVSGESLYFNELYYPPRNIYETVVTSVDGNNRTELGPLSSGIVSDEGVVFRRSHSGISSGDGVPVVVSVISSTHLKTEISGYYLLGSDYSGRVLSLKQNEELSREDFCSLSDATLVVLDDEFNVFETLSKVSLPLNAGHIRHIEGLYDDGEVIAGKIHLSEVPCVQPDNISNSLLFYFRKSTGKIIFVDSIKSNINTHSKWVN